MTAFCSPSVSRLIRTSSRTWTIALALVWTSSTSLRLRVDGDDPLVGFGDARQQHVDLILERRDLAAVLGDVGQVRLAARADFVDALDFGLDRVDELLAAGNRGDALVELGRRAA